MKEVMEQSRREFLRNAAALAGSTVLWGTVPEAIARAFSIDPEHGTTFMDAEHIVILMQENRSFDHSFGSLKGVRGFRDKRAHVQPNGHKVWFQTDAQGRTYSPFRLDMKGSNVTWIGGLPHSWPDQVDARNGGLYDKWLIAKARKDLPFTMGYYSRKDLPFYYSLADAFTVCDHAFCSSLTGTTPNRLFLWSGTIRKDASDAARVQNGDTDYDSEAAWPTFPERLEDAGVSWRVYQNEISLYSGLSGEEDAWLANFTDNPLEWMSQHSVRFSKSRRAFVAKMIQSLPVTIAEKEKGLADAGLSDEAKAKLKKELDEAKKNLQDAKDEQRVYNDQTWAALPARAKALHEKAFTTNEGDADFRSLETLTYQDGDTERTVKVPKGDVLHRFRKDVDTGQLPSVSWIIAPETFSDHPGSAWFGAWYLSEVMNILTKNPEVWKKTIFILCYDENDGYFDHVPPFVAPHPGRPETGKTSPDIDTAVDVSNNHNRDSSIGLGFRCPMVVASPWSRGGCVNSQVFDHTSVIQLVETWLGGKGKKVKETNISAWRRAVCGDMTSIFRPYNGEKYDLPKPLDRDETIIGIHKARFMKPMEGTKPISEAEMGMVDVGVAQEPGTKPSCPLPYQLEANAVRKGGELIVKMSALKDRFGAKSQGSGFNVYSYGDKMIARAYAVSAGNSVEDSFAVGGAYDVRIDGPNGFMRRFQGAGSDPALVVTAMAKGDKIEFSLANGGSGELIVEIRDESYGAKPKTVKVPGGKTAVVSLDVKPGKGWYDFKVVCGSLAYQYAGRLETGKWGITDPAMG